MRYKYVAGIMLTLAGLLLASCAPAPTTPTPAPTTPTPAPTTPTPAPTPQTLKIGAIYCLSGWAAPGEVPASEGVPLAVDWINDNGGITVNGVPYKLEVIMEDIKSTAEDTIAACTKLVFQDKVKFIVGGVVSNMNVAANSVTGPAGVLLASQYNCCDPHEVGPTTPLTFTVCATYSGFQAAFAYLKETHPEVKTLSVIHPGDGSQPYSNKFIEPMVKELGITYLYSGEWPLETVDFTPVVAKAIAANPDALAFTNGWAYHVGSMCKAARALGYKGVIFSTNVEPLNEVIGYAGVKEAEGYFIPSWDILDPKMPSIVIKEIVPRGYAKYGRTHHWHLWGWTAVWDLAQAIESAQSLDPAVVAEHWRTMKTMETPWGTGTIGGLKTFGINDVVSFPRAIMQVIDGKVTLVKWYNNPIP